MASVFEKHPKKTIFFLVIFLFILMDFIFSTVYYNIVLSKEKTSLGIPHSIYHHDFQKNGVSKETGRLGDYTIYTNSLGFKDSENRKISKKTDNRRIVFIGDSFTEGILLDYEDTYVGIIDSVLSEKNIEVLNAGRVSYSPIIYWKKIQYLLEKKKLEFDELVVFIDISDIDDEASYYNLSDDGNVISQKTDGTNTVRDYGLTWISNKNIRMIKMVLRKHFLVTSYIINGIHDMIFDNTKDIDNEQNDLDKVNEENVIDSEKTVRSYSTWDYILTDYRSNWTFDDYFYNQFGEIGKERMLKYMDNLKKLCDKNNIKLTVVVYPWPSQIWYDDFNSRHVKIWQEWTNENGIDLINLFPSFFKLGLSEEQKLEIMNKYYIPYDLHFNRTGNKHIAEEFLKYYFN